MNETFTIRCKAGGDGSWNLPVSPLSISQAESSYFVQVVGSSFTFLVGFFLITILDWQWLQGANFRPSFLYRALSLSIIVCLDIICHVNKSVHCENEVHPDWGFSDFHSIHGWEREVFDGLNSISKVWWLVSGRISHVTQSWWYLEMIIILCRISPPGGPTLSQN